PPPTKISTLSLHDALPIFDADEIRIAAFGRQNDERRPVGRPEDWLWILAARRSLVPADRPADVEIIGSGQIRRCRAGSRVHHPQDRKSTRLNSSHVEISYA